LSLRQIFNVLSKSFAREFFRMNSGFFLLFGTLAFGFMSEIEHRALAQFFVSTSITAMIPSAVWLLYTMMIIRFNRNQLQLDENRFLFNLQFLSTSKQAFLGTAVFSVQFSPALAYAIYLIKNAVTLPTFYSIGIIVAAVVLCTVSGSAILFRNLNRPYRKRTVSRLKGFLDRRYVKPITHFYVEWLLRKDPFMLLATKIFTGAVLLGVCNLYRHEAYDWRLMAMSITLCGIANIVIVFHLVNYEHFFIGWIKNLPLKKSTRLLRLVMIMIFFLLPEFVVLLKNYPSTLNPSRIALDAFFLVSIITFLVGFMHTAAAPLEYFIRKSLWIFVVLIVMILFKIPLTVLAGINTISGGVLFMRHYYLFEATGRSQPAR
jgi:hypothetical protein